MRATAVAIFASALALITSPLFAQDASTSASSLPPKALILGVPYVSWNEAALLRYEDKSILNPSHVATGKMIRRYWGQDTFKLFQFGPEDYLPNEWKGVSTPESGQGLDDLKQWIARGVPVHVTLPLTPHAHPVPFVTQFLMDSKGTKLPDRGPSSQAFGRWATGERLLELGPAAPSALGGRYAPLRSALHVASRAIIGYDDERKVMILHDPSFGPAFEMGYDEFESSWRLVGLLYDALPPAGYAEFVAKRPAGKPYSPRTPDMQAAVHFAYGYGFSEIGRASEAEREFETGLNVPGIGNGYRHLLAYELAIHRKAGGRVEEAIALLRQAIDALPEAPPPYLLLTEIYKGNPSLHGAQQSAIEVEQAGKSRCCTPEGMRAAMRKLPADFFMPVVGRFRSWACGADPQRSRC